MLSFLVVMFVAAAALAFVAWPLRAGAPVPGASGPDPRLAEERDRAQLAKDRKLDEIRELRADRQAGKITKADAAVLERQLRSEAADLLHALDLAEAALDEARGEPSASAPDPAAEAAEPNAAPAPSDDGVPPRTPEPLP
jgi:hypothetical protein